MKRENIFKKGTLSYLFYEIDTFFNTPAVKNTQLVFQILFIIVKTVAQILFWTIKIVYDIVSSLLGGFVVALAIGSLVD